MDEQLGDHGKYRHHKYQWSMPYGDVSHCWELVCGEGAVHFRVSVNEKCGTTAGLEFHSLTGEGAPHHVNCPLTGGRCWHDGTSLYASETIWPMVEPMLRSGDHATIFRVLEHEAETYFARHRSEAA